MTWTGGTKRPHGQLRRSQLITTFGPGAMLDLPKRSGIVGGLESWGDPIRDGFQPVIEERLLAKVHRVLERTDVQMFAPPVDAAFEERTTGITVWQFPEWFIVQFDERWGEQVRSRRLVHRRQLRKHCYYGPDKKSHPVVPVRFVRACIHGHIGDIDWHRFVHEKGDDCRRQLWFDERGTSGDLADIFVRCECTKSKPLTAALPTKESSFPLGPCDGHRPWLGANAHEVCAGEDGKPQPNRLLVRAASNAYFTQLLSVIHIPEGDAELKQRVDEVWTDYLMYAEDQADITKDRKKAKVAAALEGHSDEAVWNEVQRRQTGIAPPDKSIKEAEIETLLQQKPSVGDDKPGGDFYAVTHPLPKVRSSLMSKIDRVVLVHRLREVTAQIGFTRFEAAMPDIDGELALDIRRAALAREAAWVPAVENRGEGFLVAFDEGALDEWAKRPKVQARLGVLRAGFDAWCSAHPKAKAKFPGPRYILLHSLSHLLITAVSLSAGYSASSIRERVYVTNAGSGILLFTATPDAEGTLGGLVDIGRGIEAHLRSALELGMLCSNDPVCAQHRSDNEYEERFLHGAACHGCLLIAEPSCERRNELLDRALVVPTVEDVGAEFFSEDDL